MEATFGERLERWLMFKGIKPAALARALGVSRPAVHGWVHGDTAPTMDKLGPIVAALGITQAVFFGDMPDLHNTATPSHGDADAEMGPHPSTGDITRELDVVAMEHARNGKDEVA